MLSGGTSARISPQQRKQQTSRNHKLQPAHVHNQDNAQTIPSRRQHSNDKSRKQCIGLESNPGHIDGSDVFCN